MENSENSIELQIAAVLSDIRQKGFSSVQPFSIGKVEERMIQFAQVNAIVLASDELFKEKQRNSGRRCRSDRFPAESFSDGTLL